MAVKLLRSLFLTLSCLSHVLEINSQAGEVGSSALFGDEVIFDVSWPGDFKADQLTSNNVPSTGKVT